MRHGGSCEHVFVTAQGSTYSQFKRALRRKNFLDAWTLAAELPQLPLADALALLLLARDADPERYARAAVRWHSRLCADAGLLIDEGQLVLAALNAVGGEGAPSGARALLAVLERHGLSSEAKVLRKWVAEVGAKITAPRLS